MTTIKGLWAITLIFSISVMGSDEALAASESAAKLGTLIRAAAKPKKLPPRENMQKNYHYEASKVGDRFVHWRLVRK